MAWRSLQTKGLDEMDLQNGHRIETWNVREVGLLRRTRSASAMGMFYHCHLSRQWQACVALQNVKPPKIKDSKVSDLGHKSTVYLGSAQ